MGTTINLWLEHGDSRKAMQAFVQVVSLFAHYESVFSRFQLQSELSILNRRAGQWTQVSKLFWDVLQQALLMADQTNGRFDPTLLKQIESAGYDHSFEILAGCPSPVQATYEVSTQDWQAIILDLETGSVYLPAGMGLDLGGIAKGITAQKAADLLSQWGPCLIDAGGDIVAGPAPSDLIGWPVAVCGPRDVNPQLELFTLPLSKASLATSGIDFRRWTHHDRRAHHLINPATGLPAETDLQVVTVFSESASTAEAWTTATIINGSEEGMATLSARHIPAMMITQSKQLILTPEMANLATVMRI